jgi:hypothetical protein
MTAKLTLFVYVIGLGSLFHVDIGRSKTVNDLKDAISLKKPNGLKHIDARRLVLYKVKLPYSENLERLVSQTLKEELENPLSKLSKIFPKKPSAQVISILVEVPVISE